MPSMPDVTVVIPTYNRHAFLREALETVAAQTYQNYRVYISDNGSTDGTEALVAEYGRTDPRISYHRFACNVGIVPNWQQALSGHRTAYVALLNDDDLWLPDHLAQGIQALEQVPEAAWYCCQSESFGASVGNRYGPLSLRNCAERTLIDSQAHFADVLRSIPALPAAMIFRRETLERIYYPPIPMLGAIDWLICGQAALHGPIIYDPAIRVKYRLHPSNVSAAVNRRKIGGVQQRYVFRLLAEMALEQGRLDAAALAEEVIAHWPAQEASTMVVALAIYEAHPALRRAAFTVLRRRAELTSAPDTSRHCHLAAKLGTGYLTVADLADRLLVRWWPPQRQPASV